MKLRSQLLLAVMAIVWSSGATLQAQTPALHPASEFADPGLERLPDPLPEPNPPLQGDEVGPLVQIEVPLDEIVEDPVVVAEPDGPIRIWTGSFEAGINGTAGNSQALNIRVGANVKRQAEASSLSIDALYRNDSSGTSEVLANRFYFDARQEWPIQGTPWSVFLHNLTEFDDFQVWRERVTADAGVGYQFIENDRTNLIGRLSAGASREFSGPDQDILPQGLAGFDLQHKITPRQSLGLVSDYFVNWEDLNQFRLNSKVEYTVLLSEGSNLSLKFSVLNRHDSHPEGKKPNDLDYATMLLWEF